ncbi:long-chain-fatty-acid--CoA ligase heimdall [Scaptodrosophila lebanonensis]|uniref:long-chain-fatty-acid--CoA ligase n=1 Tax=Drosophila lebanonensis TaxID=7225 RepID=A0A6J2TPU5_DROLE|nr:long-chain-fatty-acid--CoA ligase heimdall [Scaptodrosophila lebanonensis]
MNEVDLNQVRPGNLKPATSYTSNSLHDAVKLRIGDEGIAAIAPQTLPEFFGAVCSKYAKSPALVFETPDGWTTLSYEEYERKVRQSALMLLHVGLEPRTSIGILAFNCPEWFYAELGAIHAGGILAGIYPSNSAEAVHHVLETSEATVCVVDDDKQMAKLRAIKERLPRLKSVIQLHGPYDSFVGNEPGYYRWSDLEQLQLEASYGSELDARVRSVHANECAMLIFTSGTVGMPKAVMLSHDAVIFDAKTIAQSFENVEEGHESLVTYLPLNHIAAQVFDIFLAMAYGGCVYFADRNALKGTLTRTFAKARPTRMFGVPRIFEKFQEQLLAAEANSKPYARLLLGKARATVRQYHLSRIAGNQISLYGELKYWLASRITRSIKQALGLAYCKTFIIGGAPVTDELKHYFLSLDIPLCDVYGMSETGGGITLHTQIKNLSSSGRPVEGFEVKINAPDSNGQGELCVRGRSNFMGYLNEPLKTSETIKEDGWLHSGDLGYLDPLGNVIISGRLKELIITAGGENIPPVHIEELIKRELPCVSNALLVGDHRKYLTVLLTLKTDTDAHTGLPLDDLRPDAVEWLQSLNLHYTRLSELLGLAAPLKLPSSDDDIKATSLQINPNPKLMQAIEEGIKSANRHAISNAQKVQKFALLPHDFSIPTGELGPTLKVRRNIVLAKYAEVIERLYK